MRELTIEPGTIDREYWRDLWAYRGLLAALAWRDVSVRYKQTAIGIAWALLRPLFTMAALTFAFGTVAGLPSSGATPYAVMVLVAMLPWQLFSSALTSTSESLVSNSNLVSKVYFPRLLVPTAALAVSLVDFVVGIVLLAAVMGWYGLVPSAPGLAVIPLAALAGSLALGPGLLLSTLNVKYRDVRHALPFVTQFGLYVTPVGFSSTLVPEKWKAIFELNPLVGVIDGFRWALLDSGPFPLRSLMISTVASAGLLALGAARFRADETTFADEI